MKKSQFYVDIIKVEDVFVVKLTENRLIGPEYGYVAHVSARRGGIYLAVGS